MGHQAIYRADLGPKPEGSVFEQLVLAEATALQFGASTALGHALTGGRFWVMEKGLDLSLRPVGPFRIQASQVAEAARWRVKEDLAIVDGFSLMAMSVESGKRLSILENVRHLVSGIFKKEPIPKQASDLETLRKNAKTYKARALEKTAEGYRPVMAALTSQLPDSKPLRVRYEKISEMYFDGDGSQEFFHIKFAGSSPPLRLRLIDAIRMGLFDLDTDKATRRNFAMEGLYIGEWVDTSKAKSRKPSPTARLLKPEDLLENGVMAQELATSFPLLFFPVKEGRKFRHPNGETYRARSAEVMLYSSSPKLEMILVGEESGLSRTIRIEAADAMDLGWAFLNNSGKLVASLDGKRGWLTFYSPKALLNLSGGQTVPPSAVLGEKETAFLALSGDLFGERLPNGRVLLSKLPLGPYSALKDFQVLTEEQFRTFGFRLEELEGDEASRMPFAQNINWEAVKVAAHNGVRIDDLRNPSSPLWIMRVGNMPRDQRNLRKIKGGRLFQLEHVPLDASSVELIPTKTSEESLKIDPQLAMELGPGTFYSVREKE